MTSGVRSAIFTSYTPDPPLPLGMRPGFLFARFLIPLPVPTAARAPVACAAEACAQSLIVPARMVNFAVAPHPLRAARRWSSTVSGAAAECPGEGIAATHLHWRDGGATMTAAMPMPGSTASTFPIHHFPSGPDGDGRFVVARIRALACDDIRPVEPRGPTANGRGKTTRIVASRKKAEAMRPDRTEFIVCNSTPAPRTPPTERTPRLRRG